MQYTFFGRAKSVAGAAFIGVGSFVFCNNLSQAFRHWNDQLSAIGILPTVILAFLRGVQAYASGHQRFVQDLFQHALMTLWPLLLVIAGTALSRDTFPGDVDASTKKDRGLVALTVVRH
jgi:hypothetical protein